MHSRSLIVVFSMLCISSLQSQTTRVADPQAIAVLTKALAASVTQTLAPAVQDTVAQGNVTYVNGTTASIRIETKGFNELRQDITYSDHQVSYVSAAGKGYSVRNGVKTSLPLWVTQYRYPEHIPLVSQMADFSSPVMNLTYVGLETISGVSVYHIRMGRSSSDSTPADIVALLSGYDVFIDANTYLLVKSQGLIFSPETLDNHSVTEMYYSDYRSVDGILVPFHISRFISGSKYCDITVTSVSLNVGLSDTEFQ